MILITLASKGKIKFKKLLPSCQQLRKLVVILLNNQYNTIYIYGIHIPILVEYQE